ncbi:hypothetical protein [Prescottella agglutinans]|uniref:Outer membrane channel protein CpnT-like N-terminal domain-containing protein n=1 Tax=Prescottella agglutinans TaxID=1644129 RepID=A0ABT6M3P7_9NOCA|nr:hypothetical protein [Prescottella agglutinans]MDH6278922.1 hypothetical protein [Prescottella agglutinans]
MGIEIPGALRTVASVAVGQDWPEADETSLRRLADVWAVTAADVERIGATGSNALEAALAGVDGAVNAAMRTHWQAVGGGDGVVPQLAEVCRQLADSCEATAAEVEQAKLMIIGALVSLAAEIAALAASAVATFGTSAAAIPAAELATQFAIRQILLTLLRNVAKEALVGVVKEVAIAGGIQLLQTAQGNRDGLDFDALKKDALGAAAEGAISGLIGKDGAGGMLMDHIGNAGGKAAAGVAVDLGVGGIGTAAGDVAKGEDVTLESVTKGAFTEAVGGVRDSTRRTPPSSLNMN